MPRTILLACLVGLLLRVAVALLAPVQPTWDGRAYERAASQLARGEGYTHRMIREDARAHPTTFYPVGWPAVLGAWRMAGAPRALDPLLQALFGTLAIALTAVAARRFGRRASGAAAWAVALWPSGVFSVASWLGEPLFTVACLAAVIPLTQTRSRIAGIIGAGILFGLAAYVRPTALAIAPLALAAYAYTSVSRPWRVPSAILAAIVGTAVSIAILAPWMERNDALLGRPVITTNGSANLLVGTITPHFAHAPAAIDCPPAWEIDRDQCRRERAIERIADDPLRWVALAPLKLALTFGYEGSAAFQLVAAAGVRGAFWHPLTWALGTVATLYWLALIALVVKRRRRLRRSAAVLLAPAIGIAIAHVIFIGGDRYHEPLVPLLIVLASPLLAVLARKVARRPLRKAETWQERSVE
jgi:hypothetical protein